MKRLIIILLWAVTAFGGTASIVTSWPSPSPTATGIDYHGGYIYHSYFRNAIYETTTTGSLLRTIPSGDQTRNGLDRTDLEFWTTGPYAAILRLSTAGSWIGTIAIPTTGRGVTYGGGYLWLTGNDTRIYKITTAGLIVTTFRIPTVNPRCICYDNGYLWIVNSNIGAIAHATTTGSFIESYNVSQDPYGVTREGNYIWYSDITSNWVYKMYPQPGVAVAPASLGNIKALYR